MTVIDIRNVFSPKNVEILEVNDKFLYYTEEKTEQQHNNLFFLEYNRKTKRERIMANYSLNDPTFVQHLYSFDKSIVLILENGGPDIWVVKLDKSSGKEIQTTKLETYGPLEGCYALDERHILVYTKSTKTGRKHLEGYRKLGIDPKVLHMYDIEDRSSFRVLDERLCKLGSGNILTYNDGSDKKQALIMAPYGSESLKEQCYKNSRWLKNQLYDSIWLYPFDDLISEIKSGEKKHSLVNLVSVGNEGLARFTGMDKQNIYFRVKDFTTAKEKICSCDKNSLKIKKVLDIIYNSPKTYYHTDKDDAKIYRISEKRGICHVEGLMASKVDAYYDRFLGEFIGCVDDRFVITRKIITDKQGKYSFEYNYIIDSKHKTHEGFECKAALKNNTLVLF